MSSDEQDKAGIVAPPPLIYLAALVSGLLLTRSKMVCYLEHDAIHLGQVRISQNSSSTHSRE